MRMKFWGAAFFAALIFSWAVIVLAAGNSSTTTVQVVTLANTPDQLEVDAGNTTDTSLPLSWNANGNPAGTTYSVELSEDEKTWVSVMAKKDATNKEAAALKPNTSYFVRVNSYNLDGKTNGKYLTGSFKTKASKPLPPKITINDGKLTVEWTNQPGTESKLYNADNQLVPITPGETSKVIDPIVPNTKYAFHLVSSNEAGDSSPSDSAVMWTDANPPINLQLTERREAGFTVAVESNGNPEGTEYEFRVLKDETLIKKGDWQTMLSYPFDDLKAGEYTVSVRARNSLDNDKSPGKETTEIKMITGTVPVAPDVEFEATETTIVATLLTKSESNNLEYRIVLLDSTGIEITASEWAKNGEKWTAESMSYTFTSLHPNEMYVLRGEVKYAD